MRIALLCVVVALAASSAHAATESSFRGRGYVVAWPDEAMNGVVVFLHGASRHPLQDEREAIATVAKLANEQGLVAVFPRARRACGSKRCWALDDVTGELAYLDALLVHLGQTRDVAFAKRQIVGYRSGGSLLGAAVEQGLLGGFTRVGILGGRPVGRAPLGEVKRAPPLYLEVGSTSDARSMATQELFRRASALSSVSYFREVPGDTRLDAARIGSFLRWFWGLAPV